MPIFYVAPAGNDLTGDGSISAPFKTLEHALGLSSIDFTLIDSTTIYLRTGNYSVSKTLASTSVQNLAIRAYPSETVTLSRDFDDGALFDMTEMPGLLIADIELSTTFDFAELIRITNCNLSALTNLKITDINIPVSTVTSNSSIIYLNNTYTTVNFTTVDNISCPDKTLSVINCRNASFTTVKNTLLQNVTATDVTGISCNTGNLQLTTETIEIKRLTGSVASRAINISLAAVKTEILLDLFKISECHTGIQLSNNPVNHQEFVRIRRGEIYDCHTGISTDSGCCRLYNNVVAFCSYGLIARLSSKIFAFNNIWFHMSDFAVPGMTAAIRSIESSEVILTYTALFENHTSFAESAGGLILRQEFVRFINPQFEDAAARKFTLLDESPLIDIGLPVDYPINGAAVDLGKYDRDRLIPIEEIESLTAKLLTRTYRPQLFGSPDVQALLTDILAEVAPDVSVREGSVINDLLVKPHALMYQKFIDLFMVIARNQSILAADFMSAEELDSFAANHYIVRIPGTLATVTARIYTPNPVNMAVSPQDIFSTMSGLRYFPRQYVTISAAEMSLNIEGGNYFLDVPLEAENFGSEFNIVAGDLTEWLGAPAVVSHVTNISDSTLARDVEDNQELISRTVFAIGNRSLVNPLGIPVVLRDEFPEILRVVPIGARDPEMVRDILATFHVYGKTDIYVSATELALSYLDIQNIEATTLFNRTTMGNVPVIDIREVVVLDPDTAEETIVTLNANQYSLTPRSADNRYSIYDELDFTVAPEFIGADIRVKFRWSPQILLTHNFCQSDEQRVICEDIRVKHMIPVFLSFNINYKAYGDLDTEAIIAEMTELINTFPPSEEFQVSDLIDIMYKYGADFVEQPLIVEARYLHQDGSVETKFFQNTNTIPRIYGYIKDVITLTRLP